jgi:hypothetical protein
MYEWKELEGGRKRSDNINKRADIFWFLNIYFTDSLHSNQTNFRTKYNQLYTLLTNMSDVLLSFCLSHLVCYSVGVFPMFC